MSSSLIDTVRPHLPADLAGATTFTAIADWAADLDPPARRRLGLPGRIPAISTVWRFLVRVDATVLQAVLTGWLRRRTSISPAVGDGRSGRVVIAVDGKALRGARLPHGRQVHLLSAYEVASGMVLAQIAVAAESNENPRVCPAAGPGPGPAGVACRHHHRRRRAACPGRPRQHGGRPGRAADGHGEGQPPPSC
jgi:hypothetical protein